MTSNDDKTLRVEFDPDVNNPFRLSIYIVDNRSYKTNIHVRNDQIELLLLCLLSPTSSSVLLITMTGDYDVKWWSGCEVAFINYSKRSASTLSDQEASELSAMIINEMSRESDPLVGAKRRLYENLRGVFA